MVKKTTFVLLLLLTAMLIGSVSCGPSARVSSSTQDSSCNFTAASNPGKQRFNNSKPKLAPAPDTPIGRR